ncbi:MAG TPA: bifunctional hydroxymethylpyrimidine kinase/phosphomethylpyrimidine kinase [Steroidobacteraceae bacterium]|nr:bifunctional hydroxymethylpyrimidine kinase/phosphomethylpyrimidine kinase [Steroidobacteraceae bacterium]
MSGRPAVLVIAGSDSSGGAGIVRDLKALSDFGCDAACAITAVTAQTHDHVVSVHHVPPEIVRTQIRAALESRAVGAIKIGMLGTGVTVSAVADSLAHSLAHSLANSVARGGPLPIVLDPVLLSSSGGVLLDEEGRAEMRARLFPLATVLTPNIPEAASLCGMPPATTREALLEQARSLLSTGARAVLLKGGHAEGAEAVDLLLTAHGAPQWLSSQRLEARCRGTGCALASAIAAGLASGHSVEEACRRGKRYVLSIIAAKAS